MRADWCESVVWKTGKISFAGPGYSDNGTVVCRGKTEMMCEELLAPAPPLRNLEVVEVVVGESGLFRRSKLK